MLKPKVYLAHKMTGRTGLELCQESWEACRTFAKHDCIPLDPVLIEEVKPTNSVVNGGAPGALKKLWKRDKEIIREAHVVVDLTGDMKSEGVLHEIGYARYFLWRPVIRVVRTPFLGASIAELEDDGIVPDFDEAAALVQKRWGTWTKRTLWRLNIVRKGFFKWAWYQLLSWR